GRPTGGAQLPPRRSQRRALPGRRGLHGLEHGDPVVRIPPHRLQRTGGAGLGARGPGLAPPPPVWVAIEPGPRFGLSPPSSRQTGRATRRLGVAPPVRTGAARRRRQRPKRV